MRKIFLMCVIVIFATNLSAQTEPATNVSLPEGPLQVTVTGIEGIVQARTAADQPWQKATVGMVLNEGAEFRTGPRSAVRFTIPPDQTITLDRLGTLQILRANFQNGKLMTDLGMKYGRTRYDIESAGREHDAKVHSPSSVLAIRGTQVSLTDQPPFAPEAVSLTGRAFFRDVKKQIAFGNKNAGKTVVSTDSDNSASHAKDQTINDPRGQFSGRTQQDDILQLSLAAYGGSDFSNLGVLSFFEQARNGTFKGSVIGTLPIGRQLEFLMFWTGSPATQIDLSITSPLGEVVSPTNQFVPSSGHYLGNNISDPETGVGQETIDWEISYPVGNYKVRADLQPGKDPTANAAPQIFVIDDPLGAGNLLTTITGNLTPQSPTLTGSVDVTGQTPPPTPPAPAVSTQSLKSRAKSAFVGPVISRRGK